jgi:hypothetical protein
VIFSLKLLACSSLKNYGKNHKKNSQIQKYDAKKIIFEFYNMMLK